MFRSVVLVLVVGFLALVAVGSPVLARCICIDSCPADLDECKAAGRGGCYQILYNYCVNGGCGGYHPKNDHCFYGCTWYTYRCPGFWGWYYCENIVVYWEDCFV